MISSVSKPALIYLVYGNDQKYQIELTYSVLSALREAKEYADTFQICLFCDEQNRRPDLPVEHYVMSENELSRWSLGGKYPHAIKIFATMKALELRTNKICFVDTDTAFLASPKLVFDRITSNMSVMHAMDGTLSSQPIWEGILRQTESGGLSELVHPDAKMLNSGLIGVDQSMAQSLEDANRLMQSLISIEQVFNIEQFALGAILQRDFGVMLADDVVEHYWGYRRYIYHGRLPSVLSGLEGEYSAETARTLPTISAPAKLLRARIQTILYASIHNLNAGQKFAYLAYLCSLSALAKEDREIWANIAVGMLRGEPDSAIFFRRHFRRFPPEFLQTFDSDAPKTKK